jgi:hypothetical protein
MLWYATAGHHPDPTDCRAQTTWYPAKSQPSTLDMIVKLRRVLLAAQNRPAHPQTPTPEEIHAPRLAWDIHAA